MSGCNRISDLIKRLFGGATSDAGHGAFNTCAFLDTNIILEGKPLQELPWSEVDPVGAILVLFTPTVLSEH